MLMVQVSKVTLVGEILDTRILKLKMKSKSYLYIDAILENTTLGGAALTILLPSRPK